MFRYAKFHCITNYLDFCHFLSSHKSGYTVSTSFLYERANIKHTQRYLPFEQKLTKMANLLHCYINHLCWITLSFTFSVQMQIHQVLCILNNIDYTRNSKCLGLANTTQLLAIVFYSHIDLPCRELSVFGFYQHLMTHHIIPLLVLKARNSM